MAVICGIDVGPSDAWWIVDQLRLIGRADDATAAAAIERGLIGLAEGIELDDQQCEAVLVVLVDCPRGLSDLRLKLLRDHHHRRRSAG